MRTAEECLTKADEMEREADQCRTPATRQDFLDLARSWRAVARRAQLQDAEGQLN